MEEKRTRREIVDKLSNLSIPQILCVFEITKRCSTKVVDDKEKMDFLDKLGNLSPLERIAIWKIAIGSSISFLIRIINEIYEKKPRIKFNESIKKLKENDKALIDGPYEEERIEKIISARICAREIAIRLSEFDEINSLNDIEVIVSKEIKVTKK